MPSTLKTRSSCPCSSASRVKPGRLHRWQGDRRGARPAGDQRRWPWRTAAGWRPTSSSTPAAAACELLGKTLAGTLPEFRARPCSVDRAVVGGWERTTNRFFPTPPPRQWIPVGAGRSNTNITSTGVMSTVRISSPMKRPPRFLRRIPRRQDRRASSNSNPAATNDVGRTSSRSAMPVVSLKPLRGHRADDRLLALQDLRGFPEAFVA